MMDTNLPGNVSRPQGGNREAPQRVERVVQGPVVRRKTPLGRRIGQHILGGDSHSVWGYILGDALIPTVQNLVVDIVGGGIERLVYPDSQPTVRSRYRGNGRPTNYNGISSRRAGFREPRDDGRAMSSRGRANHSFDEIIIGSRAEALEVLHRMMDYAHRYEVISVGKFYDMVGIKPEYTDERYGWDLDSLQSANVVRAGGRGGFLINLPRPELLDS